MKIFITTGGRIWNPERSVFDNFKKELVVIQLDKRQKVKSKGITTISLDIGPTGLGHVIDGGFDSPYYRELINRKSDLELLLDDGETVIVLGDTSVESLYVFKTLQQITKDIHLHLWAIAPFKFEGRKSIEKYHAMIKDLNNMVSITLTDPLDLIIKHGMGKESISECVALCQELVDDLFEDHLDKIRELDPKEKYFYDYHNEKFIDVDEGLMSWENNNSAREAYHLVTSGIVIPDYLLVDDMDYEDKLRRIKSPVPRVDGKEICRKLRSLRKAYADANNLPYFPKECHYDGPCAGTCVQCDEELAKLSAEIKYGSKVIPQYEIHWERIISKEEYERMLVGTMGVPLFRDSWRQDNE